MTKQTSRQFKVYKLHRAPGNKEVPQLKISGAWIEQLGFKIGQIVNVTTRDRLLIIEPVEAQGAGQDYKAALGQVKGALKKLVK